MVNGQMDISIQAQIRAVQIFNFQIVEQKKLAWDLQILQALESL
jgi:hypothetical protein